jgi:hypothetical protein
MSVVTVGRSRRLDTIRDALLAARATTVLVCAEAATQAAAATVAAALECGFACLRASPSDLLARDLEALCVESDDDHSPGERLDIGEVNGIAFVNYVAIGLRVEPTSDGARVAVANSANRGDVSRTLRPGYPGAPAIGRSVLVSNNGFRPVPGGIGRRQRLNSGRLAVFVRSESTGVREWQPPARPGWSLMKFELFACGQISADVDGTTRVLQTPLRFRAVAGAVRLLSHTDVWPEAPS